MKKVIANTVVLLVLAALAAFFMGVQSHAVQWIAPSASAIKWAFFACFIYSVGVVTPIILRRLKQKSSDALRQSVSNQEAWLVAYATQTGTAEVIAAQTAESLRHAGCSVTVLTLAQLDIALLQQTKKALFIVSTTGEGDAPDHAIGFIRRVMSATSPLPQLQYGLLALGDRSYSDYCAFGRQLEAWLLAQGAKNIFERIEVDDVNAEQLQQWQQQLTTLTGVQNHIQVTQTPFSRYRLVERECVNTGSVGGEVYRIFLKASEESAALAAMQWKPGDIAEVKPQNSAVSALAFIQALSLNASEMIETATGKKTLQESVAFSVIPSANEWQSLQGLSGSALVERLKPLGSREYTIASLPEEGGIELLLRLQMFAPEQFGVGSGWLAKYLPLHGETELRIRSNPMFHPPKDSTPLILIGNGTGMAGLRAHLAARMRQGKTRNWLLFGERQQATDYFYRHEIESWKKEGQLEKIDLAFSRDQSSRIYVQDRLRATSGELLAWVEAGAAIYVCGSLEGMAPSVHQVLEDILGSDRLEKMQETGYYRRDVY
jgi:sulfite reductase (NADPH) flavoprotein alpha-component